MTGKAALSPRRFGASMTEAQMQRETPGLEQLAREAAGLLHRTIANTDPADMDFKDVKQLTGALKDLAELLGGEERQEESGIVIRIEGDAGP